VNDSVCSRPAHLRRAAVLLPFLALALLSCKKDSTAPAVGTRLKFSAQPSAATVDSSIAPTITVSVLDASGNVVTGSSQIVTLSLVANPGGASLHGTPTAISIAGVASFAFLSVSRPGTGYSLAALAAGLAGDTSTAFNVTSLTVGQFASVSTGGNATCGITTAGLGYCWGNNQYGQLGNGVTTNSPSPTKIAGGLALGSVTVGGLFEFSCGLSTAGAAYCWGYNDYGQLGNGNFTNSLGPVAVTGGLTFKSLSAGEGGHVCAVTNGGAAYCWGYNSNGQLGIAAVAYSATPVAVSGGLSFTAISAGANGQTCGIATGGAAYCWGSNSNGELGNGTTASASAPVPVSGALTFKSINVGFASTCGVTTSGAAYCWGDNTYGELGNGSTTNSKTPVAVGGGMSFSAVAVGDAFACGLTTTGVAYCWGFASQGQLGNGSVFKSVSPSAVLGGITYATISAGYGNACAVTSGGAAYCWGDNAFGQIGDTTIGGYALSPVLVATPPSP
jgi:alpha-tubulin suppressor-like RCC1 family protein